MMNKSGDRVRLQNAKTKEWGLTGKILEQRLADDGRIVSYSIKTNSGYDTTRYRRLLRPLVEKQIEQPLTSTSNDTVIPNILENEVRVEPAQTELSQAEQHRVWPRGVTRAPVKLNL